MQQCLEVFKEIKQMVDLLKEKKVEVGAEETEEGDGKNGFKTCYSLLNLITNRLQHILKMLVKICLNKPPPNKDCPRLSVVYKACYMLSLKLQDGEKFNDILPKIADVLNEICVKLNELDDLATNSA